RRRVQGVLRKAGLGAHDSGVRPPGRSASEPPRLLTAAGAGPRAQAAEPRARGDAPDEAAQPRPVRGRLRSAPRRDEDAYRYEGGALLHGNGPSVSGRALRLEPDLRGRPPRLHDARYRSANVRRGVARA